MTAGMNLHPGKTNETVRSSPGPTDAAQDHRRAVVVCDDKYEIRNAIRITLQNNTDFRVVGEAWDADTCLDRVRASNPDVLILDVNMPGGGPDVARAAKHLRPGLQIVVYSGNADAWNHQRMLAAGADDYIVKTGRTRPLLDGLHRAATRLETTPQ